MGLDPGQEAEYQEAAKTVSGEKALSQLREQNISSHLMLALSRGDMQNFNQWAGESQQFGQDHPGQLPPMANLGRLMSRTYQDQALAAAQGTPLGTSPRNITARGMVGFANLPRQ